MLVMWTLPVQPGSTKYLRRPFRKKHHLWANLPSPMATSLPACRQVDVGRCWTPPAWLHKSENIFRRKSWPWEDGPGCLWGYLRADLMPLQKCWLPRTWGEFVFLHFPSHSWILNQSQGSQRTIAACTWRVWGTFKSPNGCMKHCAIRKITYPKACHGEHA